MEDAVIDPVTIKQSGHVFVAQEPPATIPNLRGRVCGEVVVGEYLGRGHHGPRWLVRCGEGHVVAIRANRLKDDTRCPECLDRAASEEAKRRKAAKKMGRVQTPPRLAGKPRTPPPVVQPRKPLALMPPGTVYVLRHILSGLYRAEWKGRLSLTKHARKAIHYPTVKKAAEASLAHPNSATRWNVEPLLLQRPAFALTPKPSKRRPGCTGKVRHRSEGAAATTAAMMTQRHGGSGVYNCDFCGGWHTTSKLRLLRSRPLVAESVQG